MDLFNLAFYAIVCGILGVAAPLLGRIPVRLVVGMIVGIAAAGALPTIKAAFGF
jgi:hypothetical protein